MVEPVAPLDAPPYGVRHAAHVSPGHSGRRLQLITTGLAEKKPSAVGRQRAALRRAIKRLEAEQGQAPGGHVPAIAA
ncbi:MAG: hypothetical protein FJ291_25610 [Planctomycetes bacterium]|nr:hypothetical protein [Planctomycetota bacterium]